MVALVVFGLVGSACPEWLELDDGDVADVLVERGPPPPAELPTKRARPDGRGPLVAGTPGLRVPGGYWARLRMDAADIVFPYAWVGLSRTSDQVILRLEAVGGPTVGGGGASPEPVARAIVPIALPPGSDAKALSGLTLRASALEGAAVSLEGASSRWHVDLKRLTISELGETAIVGSLEGVARRGTKGRRQRPFELGFVAYLAPLSGPAAKP